MANTHKRFDTAMKREIDVIVYGASGFTGVEVAKALAKVPFSKGAFLCDGN